MPRGEHSHGEAARTRIALDTDLRSILVSQKSERELNRIDRDAIHVLRIRYERDGLAHVTARVHVVDATEPEEWDFTLSRLRWDLLSRPADLKAAMRQYAVPASASVMRQDRVRRITEGW